MKGYQLKKYHNAKHIYLVIESKKKLIAELKCIIKHNQKMRDYETKKSGRTFSNNKIRNLNEYLPKEIASHG